VARIGHKGFHFPHEYSAWERSIKTFTCVLMRKKKPVYPIRKLLLFQL